MLLLAGVVFVVAGFLLLYPFVIYPLILSVLPRRPILRQGAAGPAPRMALLFAARNEARDLPVTLRALQSLKQHWPELEILGWNDGSTDATAEILAGAAGILRPLGSDRPVGKAAALRHMMARTDAPILIFMDANVRFRANDLLDLRGAFDDPRIGAVGARTVHAGPAGRGLISRVYWALEERVKLLESATGSTMGCDGALWAIRRELYPAFDARASDDFRPSMEPLLRGLRVITLPGLAVRERPDPEASAARRAARIATGAWYAHRQIASRLRVLEPFDRFKYMSHKYLRWFSGLWLALVLVSGFALATLAGRAEVALWGAIVLTIAARLGLWPFAGIWAIGARFLATTAGVLRAMRGGALPAWQPVRTG